MLGAASGLPVTGRQGADVVAPGMLASHYAPGKPVRLGATDFADDEFGIGFGALGGDYQLSAAGDLTEAAAHLFDRSEERRVGKEWGSTRRYRWLQCD